MISDISIGAVSSPKIRNGNYVQTIKQSVPNSGVSRTVIIFGLKSKFEIKLYIVCIVEAENRNAMTLASNL